MLNHQFDHYLRLEPDVSQRDFQSGIAAAIQDPLWFLCRQWQMGEHQGENASTPVRVTYHATHTDLEPSLGDPRDPTRIPTEAIIEAEPDSWWTRGRRIAYGARFVADQPIELGETDRLHFLPPPYAGFEDAPDGLALWRRGAVQAADYPEIPAVDATRDAWSSSQLLYNTAFDNAERQLQVARHAGGMVDWYSADGNSASPLAPDPEPLPDGAAVAPAQVQYPGAPHSRWWEIEDADTDIAGFPPDRSQFPTMLLIDLVVSHSDDWFLFPVSTKIGHIVTLHHVTVRDGFDEEYDLTFIDSSSWSLFKTSGLRDTSLVVWSAAMTPLQSAPLENVQLGIDEDANLLWAVERRLNGQDIQFTVQTPSSTMPPNATLKTADTTASKAYHYVPGTGALPFWHPYSLEADESGRRFRQAILDAMVFPNVTALPPPRAAVLHVNTGVHEVETDAVPSNGIEIERCWMLARDVAG
ncbi:MAG: hypothetical protein IT319_19065, partial [Anaerolineae bacterium]|nr:hypothetical protein [Anaerolineae bacterium]